MSNTLFVFLDESGNLDFSRKGTAHYVLSAVTTINPLVSSKDLQQLKYQHLQNGIDIECFHASEDKQSVRDEVIKCIQTMSHTIKVHHIHAQKNKTNPSIQSSSAFYAKLGTTLVKFIVGYKSNGFDQVVIIFDKCLNKKEQKAFLGEIKPELKKLGKPYRIYFHRTLSDFNGQIADYFAWSKFVLLERNEQRPMTSLSGVTQTDFDLFARGRKEWY